ncbi:MAG: glutathione S-transferase family protein [Parvibaculales bacterium]
MVSLFHHSLCPFSRKVRLILAEKKFTVDYVEERPWERRLDFLMLNPSGEVPVLEGEKGCIAGHYAISEWLEERGGAAELMPKSGLERAEVRRVMSWFDEKFHREVGQLVSFEKINRRFMSKEDGGGTPDMELVRIGLGNLKIHMSYICHLLEQRDWLAGNRLTMADLTAAAHLSCLDYTGDINWHEWRPVRDWYAGLKSRPSFRPLLADTVAGIRPVKHYTNLDF